jgi:hypothetical protein
MRNGTPPAPGGARIDEDSIAHAFRGVVWYHPATAFLVLSLLWTAGWSALVVLTPSPDRSLAFQQKLISFYVSMGGLGPTAAGLFCVLLVEGDGGVRRIVQQFFQRHNPWLWLVVPLAAAPAITAWLFRIGLVAARAQLAAFAMQLVASSAGAAAQRGAPQIAARVASAGFGVAVGHVMGWHGYLTTHLMRTATPIRTAFILGWLAAVWQLLPSYASHAARGDDLVYVVSVLEALHWIPDMAILSALYFSSRGSLLLCMGWHAAAAAIRLAVAAGSGGSSSLAQSAAISLCAANIFALPAWTLLWRDGSSRLKAEQRRTRERESE